MSLRQMEDRLFAEWRTRHTSFYPDGAGSQYGNQSRKLLIILKDGNNPGELDLRDFLDWGAHAPTWNNCARWAALVLDGVDWHSVCDLDEEARAKYLSRIAAVNLKKSHGESTVSDTALWKAIRSDADLIKQQIALYKPDVTIAGGTFQYLEDLYGLKQETVDLDDGIAKFARHPDLGLVISIHHPQAYISKERSFIHLKNLLSKLQE